MKLLNQSVKYLSISMLVIISIGMVVFYFLMLAEIKGSLDEGLENYKRQIIYKTTQDTTLLSQSSFDEGFFAIHKIDMQRALAAKDVIIDTMMYMQDADDRQMELEPVRMLTTAFEQNGSYYELRIINSMVEEDDLIKVLLWEAIILYLVLVAGIIFINKVIVQRLWKPFYELLGQLKEYRIETAESMPETDTRIKEFRDLQNAVNTLFRRNLKTYEQQKQFIGNAAHELQTPLAIAINKMELMAENESLAPADAETVLEVMEILGRMTRLNKSLLLLTKIENNQFPDQQLISINKIVQESMEELEEIIHFKEVKIKVEESEDLFVEMDISLARIVISNLIKNAVFQNYPNGEVIVSMDENRVRISNTGSGVALDSDKIFSRFYRVDIAQAGTGLGLAIVKAICDLYGFGISYFFENEKHCFEINFNPEIS